MKKSILIVIIFLTCVSSRFLLAATVITPSDILVQVNTYRAHQNLPPLKLDPIISAQAEAHSIKMSSQQIPFSHEGFTNRANFLMKRFATLRNVTENVAYIEQDGKKIVSLWLKSDSHRRNIEGNFNLTGIGVSQSSSGKIYATQIFIRTT